MTNRTSRDRLDLRSADGSCLILVSEAGLGRTESSSPVCDVHSLETTEGESSLHSGKAAEGQGGTPSTAYRGWLRLVGDAPD